MSSTLLSPKCDCSLDSKFAFSSGIVNWESWRRKEGLLEGSKGDRAGAAAATRAFFAAAPAAGFAFLLLLLGFVAFALDEAAFTLPFADAAFCEASWSSSRARFTAFLRDAAGTEDFGGMGVGNARGGEDWRRLDGTRRRKGILQSGTQPKRQTTEQQLTRFFRFHRPNLTSAGSICDGGDTAASIDGERFIGALSIRSVS